MGSRLFITSGAISWNRRPPTYVPHFSVRMRNVSPGTVQTLDNEGTLEERLKTVLEPVQKETRLAGLKTVGEAIDHLASKLDPIPDG